MADRPRDRDVDTPGDRSDVGGSGRSAPPGAPRWVKATGIVVVVLVVLVVLMLLLGHGPAQHAPAAVGNRSAPTGSAMVLFGVGEPR